MDHAENRGSALHRPAVSDGLPFGHHARLRQMGGGDAAIQAAAWRHGTSIAFVLRASRTTLLSAAQGRTHEVRHSPLNARHLAGKAVGRLLLWTDADHDVFTIRRLNCVMWSTAFRLGEIVRHTSGAHARMSDMVNWWGHTHQREPDSTLENCTALHKYLKQKKKQAQKIQKLPQEGTIEKAKKTQKQQ
ncbi:MAG: hypothetical protein SGPRY_005183 [Prymnesium sp.]